MSAITLAVGLLKGLLSTDFTRRAQAADANKAYGVVVNMISYQYDGFTKRLWTGISITKEGDAISMT